jgi:hypothetical protein
MTEDLNVIRLAIEQSTNKWERYYLQLWEYEVMRRKGLIDT